MKYSIRINKKLDKDIRVFSAMFSLDRSEVVQRSIIRFLRRINVVQNKKEFLSYIKPILGAYYKSKGTVLYSIRINSDIKPIIRYFKTISNGINSIVAWNLFNEKAKHKGYKPKQLPKIEYEEGIDYIIEKPTLD